MSEQPLLVTLDDAAAMLSISRRSAQSLIYSGELPSVKVGRSRRIAAVDLQAYVARLRHKQLGRLEVVG
jgi:excisionase family DNA binding protein